MVFDFFFFFFELDAAVIAVTFYAQRIAVIGQGPFLPCVPSNRHPSLTYSFTTIMASSIFLKKHPINMNIEGYPVHQRLNRPLAGPKLSNRIHHY